MKKGRPGLFRQGGKTRGTWAKHSMADAALRPDPFPRYHPRLRRHTLSYTRYRSKYIVMRGKWVVCSLCTLLSVMSARERDSAVCVCRYFPQNMASALTIAAFEASAADASSATNPAFPPDLTPSDADTDHSDDAEF